jgi:hypothetical protein
MSFTRLKLLEKRADNSALRPVLLTPLFRLKPKPGRSPYLKQDANAQNNLPGVSRHTGAKNHAAGNEDNSEKQKRQWFVHGESRYKFRWQRCTFLCTT